MDEPVRVIDKLVDDACLAVKAGRESLRRLNIQQETSAGTSMIVDLFLQASLSGFGHNIEKLLPILIETGCSLHRLLF